MIDLAQPILGSKIVYKTDEFFAKANRIINPNEPVFIKNKFDNISNSKTSLRCSKPIVI